MNFVWVSGPGCLPEMAYTFAGLNFHSIDAIVFGPNTSILYTHIYIPREKDYRPWKIGYVVRSPCPSVDGGNNSSVSSFRVASRDLQRISADFFSVLFR